MSGPKYPHVRVALVGTDGNAFSVIGKVSAALKRAGVPQAERDAFFREATAGSYDDLLATCLRWVDVA